MQERWKTFWEFHNFDTDENFPAFFICHWISKWSLLWRNCQHCHMSVNLQLWNFHQTHPNISKKGWKPFKTFILFRLFLECIEINFEILHENSYEWKFFRRPVGKKKKNSGIDDRKLRNWKRVKNFPRIWGGNSSNSEPNDGKIHNRWRRKLSENISRWWIFFSCPIWWIVNNFEHFLCFHPFRELIQRYF